MPNSLQTALKELRRGKSLRQEDVADQIGMKRATYALKEKTGSFDRNELMQVAQALGTELDRLMALEVKDAPIKGVIKDFERFMAHCAIRSESMLRVILMSQAEILANQRGQPVAKVAKELEEAVDGEAANLLSQLQ